MDRDRRLTGFLRGQTDNVQAPPGFELNNPWRVGGEVPTLHVVLMSHVAREAYYLVSDTMHPVHLGLIAEAIPWIPSLSL